jgi:hypothetical protein
MQLATGLPKEASGWLAFQKTCPLRRFLNESAKALFTRVGSNPAGVEVGSRIPRYRCMRVGATIQIWASL